MSKKITVIGSSNVDLIMKMKRLPEKGETVTDAEFMQVYGGKGANQAVAAARAGGEVSFISAVGNDAYTPKMLDNYREDGIETDAIFQEPDIPSGHALVMIGEGGENLISVAPGANYRLTPERIDEVAETIEESDLILMQFEIPADTIQRVMEIANRLDIPVIWNYAPALPFPRNKVGKTDILIVNELEAGYLSGHSAASGLDVEEAAQKLHQMGIDRVIITLGKRGVFALAEEGTVTVPAFEVDAVDTTSAGDVFCGCFSVALLEGQSLEESIRFANAASAICVTRMGAQPSVPTREEIDAFLNKLQT